MRSLAEVGPGGVGHTLAGPGLTLELGAARVVVRATARELARHMTAVYPHFPLLPAAEFADISIELRRPAGWRRWVRPQVLLHCDGETPFEPFPLSAALPYLEWGMNWFIGQRSNHLLLFHAGCLERDGLGLLLPAVPGSGKSTLTAALAHKGWRLLSDEFGVCRPGTHQLLAMLKPIALKNLSIEAIRRHAPQALIGPTFPNTRKGDVAHVAAPADAVQRRAEPARPAAVILPQWRHGVATRIEGLPDDEVFKALAFNCFNYEVLGETGFRTAMAVVRASRGWRIEYSDLDDAVARLHELWGEQVLPWARDRADLTRVEP